MGYSPPSPPYYAASVRVYLIGKSNVNNSQSYFQEHPGFVPWDFLSKEEQSKLLQDNLGPDVHSFKKSLIVTIIYGILGVIGVTGNFLTCVIILFNSYMRVPANFFLFSLAIADMITLIGGTVF